MSATTPLSRRLALWLALSGLALLVFLVMRPFFAPLAWAGILAYMSWPVAARIRRACRGRDTLAAGLTTLLAALILFGPLLWLVWLAQKELGQIYPLLQEFIAEPPPLPHWLEKIPWLGAWMAQMRIEVLADPQDLVVALKDWLKDHSRQAAALAGGAGKNLIKLLMVMLILFFFYRDGARILRELRHVLAQFLGPRAHGYLASVGSTTRAVVYGILLTALVQGTLAGMGYGVAGLSSPVTLGACTAIVALIPFGTPLAWGGAGAWLLFQGQIGPALGLWAWGALVVSQMDNLLRPLFISSISPIPFLLVLFGVLGGLLAFGLVGLFAGPIVLAVAWAVWREWAANLDESDGEEEIPRSE
ncbi:AI-2E family transporter [Geoalkalibacter sp.]|uniref:AI-2E family transporter n=1 Tax=Geoalkalibacter sp. TaxID=3041440 RepID=UPI00272DD2A9|nr:AI-2E family transporter [Geoalkalibacter sp.]